MNVGVDVKKVLLKKYSKDSWKQYQNADARGFYQKSKILLINANWTTASWKAWYPYTHCKDLRCLQIQFQELSNWCPMLQIPSSKVLFIVEEWSVLRADDKIVKDQYLNKDETSKCLDLY